MREIKKGTKKYKALQLLLRLGGAWKRDYLFALKYFYEYDNNQAYRLYEELLKNDLIVERVIDKYRGKRKANDNCVEVLLNTEKNIYELKSLKNYKKISRPFQSKSNKKLYKVLSEARVQIMMFCSGIKVFDAEKPSLISVLRQENSYAEWLDIIQNCGVYYSSFEVREAIASIKSEENTTPLDTDTITQSRIKGIVIKDGVFYFVYIANPRENKLIKIHNEGEKKYITTIRNKLGSINNYLLTSGNENAIVISDGDSMVYTASLGNPSGRIKKDDLLEKQKVIIENYKRYHKGKAPRFSWINSNTDMFQKIYVMPFNHNGVYLLGSLMSSNDERSELTKIKNKLSNIKEFRESLELESSINKIGTYRDTNLIYVPYYEIKLLKRIRDHLRVEHKMFHTEESQTTTSIITEPEMIEAVSHCVCATVRFYCLEKGELYRVDDKDFQLYANNGYSKGMNIVKEYIENEGYVATNKIINSLPKRAGQEYKTFWKEVEEGSTSYQKYIDFNNLKTKKEVSSRKPRKKTRSLRLREKTDIILKEEARKKGVSVNKYIADLVYKDISSVEESSTE